MPPEKACSVIIRQTKKGGTGKFPSGFSPLGPAAPFAALALGSGESLNKFGVESLMKTICPQK
jgi:hypothetical protein